MEWGPVGEVQGSWFMVPGAGTEGRALWTATPSAAAAEFPSAE